MTAPLEAASIRLGEGRRELVLVVPDAHCGACIRAIETGLLALPGIAQARVNLSERRVRVVWEEGRTSGRAILDALARLGFPARLPDPGRDRGEADARYRQLLLALAVAGFAAGNIMLLSVSVWSGADASTRDLFHWISALIAVPAVAVAGRPFFASAATALRARRLNMDVPIALAVVLALLLSLYETARGGGHAFFDAAVCLLFFLLIGRVLDHQMRRRARGAAELLARLAPRSALLLSSDGGQREVAVGELRPGDRVLIRSGDRVPVDGRVEAPAALLDPALVTGESEPATVAPGAAVWAGMLNLGPAFRLRADAPAAQSLIAGMARLMEAAEGARLRYRRLSDRAAALYAPAVHGVAGLTFLGWLAVSGDLHRAAHIAIAVLIITCPCALALAVPMVQVAAAGRLFRAGMLLKDGDALERLAEVDHVVFDKTGTLSSGPPSLIDAGAAGDAALALAAGLGRASSHPRARAILAAAAERGCRPACLTDVCEIPGFGIEAADGDGLLRLGRPGWAGPAPGDDGEDGDGATILGRGGQRLACFRFEERLRPDAGAAVAALRRRGLAVELLSGDAPGRVAPMARRLGVADWQGGATPAGKQAHLNRLAAAGRRVLMVGDGLNDGPALSAAHASMAPSDAADLGRNAADLVFLGSSLDAVPAALEVARRARRLMLQNLGLSFGYNLIAVPVAVLGHATPLVAAVAMSLSSLVVTANALRLTTGELRERG